MHVLQICNQALFLKVMQVLLMADSYGNLAASQGIKAMSYYYYGKESSCAYYGKETRAM